MLIFQRKVGTGAETYNLSADVNPIDEGNTLTITLTTTNVPASSSIPYTITGVSSGDINGASLTGNFTAGSGSPATDDVTFTITADATTEGPETLTLSLDNGKDSIDVDINDTSLTPTTPDWTTPSQQTFFDAADTNTNGGAFGAAFGSSVSLNTAGDLIVVGDINIDEPGKGNAGAVYVFSRSGSTWTEDQKLLASNSVSNAVYGTSVDISNTGDYIIAGAPGNGTGAAIVLNETGGTWSEQQILSPTTSIIMDNFGEFVAIDSDGNTAIVGAPFADSASLTNNGAAYIFTRSGSTWTQQAELTPPTADNAANRQFGSGVAISEDGDRIFVGAPGNSGLDGVGYVYTRSGSAWTLEQKITPTGGTPGDISFGQNASFNALSDVLVVGDPEFTASALGSAYVFTRSGSTWTQQQKLNGGTLSSVATFGETVDINDDGDVIVIGAKNDNSNTGAVFVFTESGGTWTEESKNTFGPFGSVFGDDVSISGDGQYIAAGATNDNTNDGFVYILVP